MKKPCLSRKETVAILWAVLTVSILFQVFRGGDAKDFLLRLLINTAVAIFTLRCRTLVRANSIHLRGSAPYGFVLRVLFWIAVAGATFIGFRISQ